MILFYHIPKTAGTSVVRAAADSISGSKKRIRLTEMDDWLKRLDAGIAEVDNIEFLSGHFGYGAHYKLPFPVDTFTILRDPVAQTLSMHYEAMKWPNLYPQGDLVTLLRTGGGVPYFGNTQVRHLAAENGQPLCDALTTSHLDRAKTVVTEELSCFGLAEYLSVSLNVINRRFNLNLTARRENVSSRADTDMDETLLSLIWEANALDRELYCFCREIFMSRLNAFARSDNMASATHD